MTAIGVGLAIVAVLLLWGILRPRDLALFVIFLAPWQGLDADVGVRITAHQLAVLALIVAVSLRGLMKPAQFGWPTVNRFIVFYVLWTLAVSLTYLPLLPSASIEGGDFRSPVARGAIQMPVFLFSLAPIVLIPMVFRSWMDIHKAAKTYMASCLVLAIIGWIQLGVWASTGTNPLPISLVNRMLGGSTPIEHEGLVSLGDIQIFRMSSFGNEPKYLGVSLVVAMLMIQQAVILGKAIARTRAMTWIFLSVSAFATLATSAIYLWAICTLVQIFLSRLRKTFGAPSIQPSTFITFVAFVGIGAIVVALTVFDPSAGDGATSVMALLYARTLGRADYSTILIEDFDEAILALLWDNPIIGLAGVGVGNIHLFANEYLAPEVAEYARSTAFTGKAGYLRVLSESGAIGLVLFCLAVLENARGMLRHSATASTSEQFLLVNVAHVSMVIGVGYLATSLIAPQMVLVIAIGAAASQMFLVNRNLVDADNRRLGVTKPRLPTFQVRP